MRQKIDFNEGWLFHLGDVETHTPANKGIAYISAKTERRHMGPASRNYPAASDSYRNDILYPEEDWKLVTLPHDYVIEGAYDKTCNSAHGYLPYRNAWYRKTFSLDESDREKRLVLYFEGIAIHAEVYLNGCLMFRSFSGYTPFEVDITDMADFEHPNVLAIYVTTEEHEGWWYEGGGIYRNVWLEKTELVSVDRDGVFAKPVLQEDGTWNVDVEVTLRNDKNVCETANVIGKLFDAEGNELAKACACAKIADHDKSVLHYAFKMENPRLWSPDDPYRYRVETHVENGGEEIDLVSVKFGLRTFYADPDKGFFINGKHYKIKGFCGHADCGLMGKAVPDNIHRYKVQLMKEMGANAYRTSHYPQSEALMEALDEAGFIVMDEVRWFESTPAGLAELEALIRRDRNRPSVFFWSVGNEEPYHAMPQGKRITRTMMSKVRKLDDTRFVMTAVDRPDTATVYEENDVIGINYNWNSWESVHEKYPEKAVFASECCAAGTTRGWYAPDDPARGYLSAYDHDCGWLFLSREFTWKFIATRPWIMGGYQWIAFEHRGETVWPRLASQSGAVDLYMQKKDAFFQNQSHYSEIPMVHLLPHWNFKGREGDLIRVVAYTNAEEVELFLNGKSLGKVAVPFCEHAEWSVPYEPGTLEAVAFIGGKEVARDVQKTSGKAYRLMLEQDTFDIVANGRDIALVSCFVVDENGLPVPDAELERVSFRTEGDCKIYSTGSDVSDHTSIFCPDRRMRAGRIGVAVKLGKNGEGLRVFASSNGLIQATLTLTVKE